MSGPARLPNGAPAALRGFVACTVDRVDLDVADMGWIPKPPGMDGLPEPGVTINDGWTSTTATIKIGWGFVSIELPATIVDGQLSIDTSNLMLEDIGTNVDKWVDAFNRTLRDNDKQLDSFDVHGNTVTMTKRAIPAGAADGVAAVAPVTSARPGATAQDPGEAKKSPPGGCLTWVIAGITAVAVAVGLYAATNGGDDDAVSTGSDPAPATTTPSTSTTSTTSTTTTVVQVGQAPTPEVQLAALPDCGDFSTAEAVNLDGYLIIDESSCTPIDDAYLPSNCDDDVLHCSFGQAPGILVPGNPGTNHGLQPTDPDTGAAGASGEVFPVWGRYFGAGSPVVRVRSNCGGSILTGQAPMVNGGITNVEQPLQSYGNCELARLEAAAEEHIRNNDVDLFDVEAVNRAAAAIRERIYTVDASEAEPTPPSVEQYTVGDDRFAVDNSWADSVNTINNTLGNTSVPPGCTWFFEPQNVDLVVDVLDGCRSPGHFWVFAAATTSVEYTLDVHDTLLATTSTYTNPLGMAAPPVADTSPFATSDPLFDNTIFPCGYGHVAYTACPVEQTPVDAGGFATVSGVFLDAVPIEGDGAARSQTVDFGAVGGPTYTVEQGDDGWTVASSVGSTRARALFRHDSITLVVPDDELPPGPLASSWTTTVDGQAVAQPVVPVVGLITTPQVTADAPAATETAEPPTSDAPVATDPATAETLAAFYEQLSASVAAGDAGFSFDRLHPTVLEAYPTECPAALASFADPDLVIEFVADNGPEPWTWELTDGRSFDIPDAVSVTIRLTGRGQTGAESNAHVAIVDGTYRWFTFCDGG